MPSHHHEKLSRDNGIVGYGNVMLSRRNETLNCGNKILSCGNEILSDYHKMENLVFSFTTIPY